MGVGLFIMLVSGFFLLIPVLFGLVMRIVVLLEHVHPYLPYFVFVSFFLIVGGILYALGL